MRAGSKLLCVDTFTAEVHAPEKEVYKRSGTLSLFLQAISLMNLPKEVEDNITTLVHSTEEAASMIPDGIHLLFLDANHERAWEDYKVYREKLDSSAMFCLHDVDGKGSYGPSGPDNTFFKMLQEGWRVFRRVQTLACLTKDPDYWNFRLGRFMEQQYRKGGPNERSTDHPRT